MKRIRNIGIILAICLLILTTAGCMKDHPGKRTLMDALAKFSDMTSSVNSGSLHIDVPSLPLDTTNQPYIEALLSSLKQGTITWQGVQDRVAERREADIRITTSDGSFTYSLPVIQHQDQIYIHIPIVNTEHEYFSIPVAGVIEDLNRTVRQSFMYFIEGMEAGWFTIEEQDDNSQLIELQISQSNWLPFLMKVNDAFPQIVKEFRESGFISEEQAIRAEEKWHELAEHRQHIQLSEGTAAYVRALVNEAGYVTELDAEMSLTAEFEPGQQETYGFHLHLTWEAIDEEPEFTKDIPELVIPFADLLKLVP